MNTDIVVFNEYITIFSCDFLIRKNIAYPKSLAYKWFCRIIRGLACLLSCIN